jgi:hypothetical protein
MAQQFIPTLPALTGAVRTYVFPYDTFAEVEAGETISSPSVPAVSGLTIGSPSITSADITQDGRTIAAGKAVQVQITSPTAGTYTVNCSVTSSGGSTLPFRAYLKVS